MIGLFIAILILGVALFILGMKMDRHRSDLDAVAAVAGVVLFFSGFLGTVITVSVNNDKNRCLKVTNQVAGTETKWLDGECYLKAKDGKFVPETWIEKGYNNK